MHPFFGGIMMKYVNIGVIANTHGIKGELKIKPLTDSIEERFVKGKEVLVKYQNQLVPFTIKTIREAKGMIFVAFEGFNNINDVEKYKGSYIVLSTDELHDLAEDEVYHFQLIGCEVVDEQDKVIGTVKEVIETGANDIIRVVKDDPKGMLIPYVKSFILDVNVKEKRIVVRLMEGL